jgi:hypothetical protein
METASVHSQQIRNSEEANFLSHLQRSPLLSDSFDILISIVGEKDVRDGEFLGEAIPQRQYVNSYYAEQGDRERIELTNRVISGGKRYLESR